MNCHNLMGRMAWKEHIIVNPPPEQPPENLVQEFTQHGEFPVQNEWYFNNIPRKKNDAAKWANYSRGFIEDLISKKQAGLNLNPYVDHYCIQNISDKYRGDYAGLSGLVVGTLSPWLEAILLANGAKHILTLEYNNIVLNHPQLSASSPYDFAEGNPNARVETFDFAASFSSIEHSGLARYGDPLNPYGDLEAMAQVWCILKPGGLFIVGVPGQTRHPGFLRWNAHRFYGPERLKHLATNWNILEVIDCPGDPHVVMVLRKPTK